MPFRPLPLVLLAALAAAPVAVGAKPAALASATIMDAAGQTVGSASVVRTGKTARLMLTLKGLTPGVHGVHFHTTGKCDAPDFKTAGGHLNPAMHQHGSMNPMGHHLGDLPNVTADAKGMVKATIPLDGPVDALKAALMDADGTAIVVHAGPDDYKTDPSGNSGGRIACGVLGA